MKRVSLALVLTLVFASVPTSANAEGVMTFFSATAPTHYEDGDLITSADDISYMIYCGVSSGVYTAGIVTTQAFVNGGEDLDVSFCVTSVGTYHFAATSWSTLHGTESIKSNEVTRTYIAQDFVRIPAAPILISVGP